MQQEVYINLDDSGKLTSKEHICVYDGVVFLSKCEKDKFITQYKSIVESLKCKYCVVCNHNCPEIKNTNISKSDKRRIINYIKKYFVIALIIENDRIYKHIMMNKGAKGRFIDYSIRRLIKETIVILIKNRKINPYLSLKLIVNIDEQSTKSNGYYNLKDGLLEELKYGISNYNYSMKINPIIFSELDVKVTYQNSNKSYVIQAADLLAGTIRKNVLNNEIENSEFIDFSIILP
ncbi:MAG: DUF3800 domain-containing protein [bacterium]|nr:DUF3800 domain-containing protein [bacterium]